MRVKKKLTIIDMHIISTKVKVLFLPFGLLNDFLAMFFDITHFYTHEKIRFCTLISIFSIVKSDFLKQISLLIFHKNSYLIF